MNEGRWWWCVKLNWWKIETQNSFKCDMPLNVITLANSQIVYINQMIIIVNSTFTILLYKG